MRSHLSEPERRVVLAAASRLLQYPDDGLLDQLPLLREAAQGIAARAGRPLLRFIEHAHRSALLDLQADYVATFDLRRRYCLYLSYHLNGDTRRRGMALWRFQELYRSHGYSLASGELPDFLPAVLELAAETEAIEPGSEAAEPEVAEPLDLLVEHQPAIESLGHALEQAGSPYADVIVALEAALPPPSRAVLEAARRLETEGPPAEQVGLEPWGSGAEPGIRT